MSSCFMAGDFAAGTDTVGIRIAKFIEHRLGEAERDRASRPVSPHDGRYIARVWASRESVYPLGIAAGRLLLGPVEAPTTMSGTMSETRVA
jgi:hypothetical protein